MPQLNLDAYHFDESGRHELRCKQHPRMKLGIFEVDDLRGANEAWHEHMREFHIGDYRRMNRHDGYVTSRQHVEWPGGVTPTEPTHGGVLVDDCFVASCSGMACEWRGTEYPATDEGREKARAEADAHTADPDQASLSGPVNEPRLRDDEEGQP